MFWMRSTQFSLFNFVVQNIGLSLGKGKMGWRCELCSEEAALHCDADCASLCWACDAKVHGANFLVARHLRMILCCRCHQYTGGSTCVACPRVDYFLCSGCCTHHTLSTAESATSSTPQHTPNDAVIASGLKKYEYDHRLLEASGNPVLEVSIDNRSSSYSENASSLDGQLKSQQKKPMITRYSVAVQNWDMKVQAILRRWYRYLNLRSPSTVTLAMHLVEKGVNKLGGLFRQKWRICLAASLWLAATLCEHQACLPSVKRVEECTGVPSKLILVAESRLATISDWKTHDEEGWAECST